MSVTAVLLDTSSIQKYIFATNRLQANIGASKIVQDIYQGALAAAIQAVFDSKVELGDLNRWAQDSATLAIFDGRHDWEVGYIGGGKALLFIGGSDSRQKAIELVYFWTKDLLLRAPGLITNVAYRDITCADLTVGFAAFLRDLHEALENNKYAFHPNVCISKFGFTAECSLSGLCQQAECCDNDDGYLSAVVKAKLDAGNNLRSTAAFFIDQRYVFTNDLDQLGQIEGQDYIAMVHIDGNQVGQMMQSCGTLCELRKFSAEVHDQVQSAFQQLMQETTSLLPAWYQDKNDGFLAKRNDGDKIILPLRPIILGGDDITFVAEGRLGVYFAHRYLALLAEKPCLDNGKKLTASAGIAIVKRKYPFYKAYQWAEELCQQAKNERQDMNGAKNKDNFLAWNITYGGKTGTIKEIRQKYFKNADGQALKNKAYFISGRASSRSGGNGHSWQELLQIIQALEKWPRNKRKDFCKALAMDQQAAEYFLACEKFKDGVNLPDYNADLAYNSSGWSSTADGTPYFDALELMDFYPKILRICHEGGE